MNKNIYIISMILILGLTSCNMPDEANNELANSENRILTAAAQTVEVILTENPLQDTDEPAVSTLVIPTLGATETPDPADAIALTANASDSTPESDLPCNLASFVNDVTVDDGDDFTPGEIFTKTWRLKNSGSCPWTTGYDLIFFDGFSMGGPASQQLTNTNIDPSDEIDISVELTAPTAEGTYKGTWKLRSSEGIVFSLSNDNAFWVEIDVVP